MTNVADIVCPKCASACPALSRFCETCGTALEGEPKPGAMVVDAALARKKARIARKTVLNVRVTLGFTAFITLVLTYTMHHSTKSVFGRLWSDPASDGLRMMFTANYVLVGIYIALAIWAGRNPFGAALTALVLYLTSTLINSLVDPTTLFFPAVVQGIALKLIIIAALAMGVKAGLARRRQLAKAAKAA